MNHDVNNDRTVASILSETKEDLKQFFQTRLTLFSAEVREKLKMIARAVPLAIVALLMLGTAYLLFTLALVGAVLALLPANPFRWCFAFLAVAVLWSIIGGIAVAMAKKRFSMKELVPNRTIGVLKGDGVWIEREVKNQI